jgi:hypothetical protein
LVADDAANPGQHKFGVGTLKRKSIPTEDSIRAGWQAESQSPRYERTTGKNERNVRMKRTVLFTLAITMLYVAIGSAQQYPIMDKVAAKVIAKYQNSTCEQLWQQKSHKTAPSPEEQKAIQLLKGDPQMRQAFIGKIAAPIANKMFECGMIP